MKKTSKTLTVALTELRNKLNESDSASLTDLSLQLASNLSFNYEPFLPYGKMLEVSVVPQDSKSQAVKLYTATYQLVDNS